MKIDFEKIGIKGTSVKSVELRELVGADSEAAAARAVAPTSNGAAPVHGFLLNMRHNDQLLADAIVAVDGAPVVNPWFGFSTWNLRTRDFINLAYQRMNAITEDEAKRFLLATGLVPEQPTTPGSSS